MKLLVRLFALFPCLFAPLDAPGAQPAGGGFLRAGLRGAYFNNADLQGAASFTRKDPRIDFSWGSVIAPGGSRGLGFNAIGTDHFSARWTGQFQTRFAETYTFTVISDDGIRLRVRRAGDADWTTVIDAWDQAGLATRQGTFACDPAHVYDLELEYREITGDAMARLFWESPSVAREIIEPIFEVSLNWVTYEEVTFADAFMNGRGGWEQTTLDAQGWPVGDGDFIVSEINAPNAPSPMEVGLMRLSFNGRADVSVFGNGFLVEGSYNYDPASNFSTATVRGQDFGVNVLNLRFRNTSRTGEPGGPGGVTNVKLMRPAAASAETWLDPEELFHPATRATFADHLTGLRFQRVNDQAREWNERTQPAWPYRAAGLWLPFVYTDRYGATNFGRTRMAHEYEIMLCNETGCDYFVNLPHLASVAGATNYTRRLAQLIRFGSDQNGVPYTEPTANPHHPPLNPNLRVYLEVSNELWNFLDRATYAPYWDFRELIEDMADANSPEFQILNFDNLVLALEPDGYHANNYVWVRRYWALKTKQISDEFRAVFGDAAMPGSGPQPRIRPYLGYRSANANQTAEIPLEFLDNYFNNGAGNFVAHPRPASDFLFAAGGAGYYGSGNSSGSTVGLIPNSSFETPPVAAPSAPAGATWQFSGDAGLAPNVAREAAISSESIGTLRNNLSGWVGLRFTVGPSPVWVYELGRYVHPGNSRSHPLILARNSDGQTVTYAQEVSGGVPGTHQYSRCVPVLLAANTTYSLLTQEEAGYDTFGDSDSAVTAASSAITIDGAVTASPAGENSWNLVNGAGGSVSFGPVNLRIAPAAALGNPDARHGTQVAFIGNSSGQNGAMEINFHAPEGSGTGVYGLAFRAVQRSRPSSREPDAMNLRITANGADITYRGINGQPQPYSPFFPWQRVSYWIGDYFFTETFTATPGQPVTLRIEGRPDAAGAQMCFLDDVQITSVDALYAAGIPDTGEALGQPGGGDYLRGIRMDARWAQSYGLHHMTYEHGWSIGGDSGASPVQEYAKYRDARAAATMVEALDIFHRAGGANATLGTYSTWPLFSETIREEGVLNPTEWPLGQGLDQSWSALPAFPDNGAPVPALLHAGNRAIGYYTSENRIDAGEWISWNLVVSERADYELRFDLAGGGGVRATLDEAVSLFHGAASGSILVVTNILPGLHTLKVKALAGMATLGEGISVAIAGAPEAPVLAAVDGDGYARLTWSEVPGAASYLIRYGPEAGFPNASIEAGDGTERRIEGLQNGVAYYFTVAARNAAGLGLPSNEVGVTPFGDGQNAELVAWDFAGRRGDAENASATVGSSRVTASLLTRGAGFSPAEWAPNDCFMGVAVNWAQTLAAAVASAHYLEFTLTPRQGRRISVASLNFRPGFQNFTGAESDPRGAGIAWRVGETSVFTAPIAVTGPRTASLNFGPLFTAELSSISELQNATVPISFRIYFHGMGPYEAGSIGGPGSDLFIVGSLLTPPLISWRELHGLNPDGGDDDDAPLTDNVSNLAKYAFNLDPAAPAHLLRPGPAANAGLPNGWLASSGAELSFQYIRRRAQTNPGITYTPLRSDNFEAWTPLTSSGQVQIIDDTWERVTHAETVAGDSAFYRVRVAPE